MVLFKTRKTQTKLSQSETELRVHRCAFTGHRPEKVEGYEGRIIVELRKEILQAIDSGYTTFLTGMSRGVDLWAADIIIHLREQNPKLKLIGVIPFEGFECKWPVDWKKHYKLVRKELDWLHVVSKEYSPEVYQKRNQFMVDHSALVLAVFNGKPGGTLNTINYAQEKDVPVRYTEVWENETVY